MKTRSVCVRGLIFVFFLAGVHCRVDAQGIAFTNDAALLKDVSALRTVDLPRFHGHFWLSRLQVGMIDPT